MQCYTKSFVMATITTLSNITNMATQDAITADIIFPYNNNNSILLAPNMPENLARDHYCHFWHICHYSYTFANKQLLWQQELPLWHQIALAYAAEPQEN